MPDPSRLQFLTLDTFPGIVEGEDFAGVVLAPLGSATRENTWGCIPGIGGRGLYPGPGRTISSGGTPSQQGDFTLGAFATLGETDPLYDTYLWCSGATTVPWSNTVLYGLQYGLGSSSSIANILRHKILGSTVVPDLSIGVGAFNPANYRQGFSSAFTRLLNGASLDPSLIVSSFRFSPSGAGNATPYPNLGAPSAFTNGGRGQVVTHAGRVLLFRSGATSTGLLVGDDMTFTDPLSTLAFTSPDTSWVPENPAGIGAVGSLNASTLLIVKFNGGGALIQGTIKAPQVATLPGLQPTGPMVHQVANTPIGVIYGSRDSGIWVWEGGSTSRLLSPQLTPNFWRANADESTTTDYHGLGGLDFTPSLAAAAFDTLPSYNALSIKPWRGRFIMVSGGWMYDMGNQSWWRLANPLDCEYLHYATVHSELGEQLVAFKTAVLASTGGTIGEAYAFGGGHMATSWSWQSQPIPVSPDRETIVREVLILAQASNANGGILYVDLVRADGVVIPSPAMTVTSSARPELLRLPVSVVSQTVQVRIRAHNHLEDDDQTAYGAPAVLQMQLGYQGGHPVRTADNNR